MRGYRCTMDSTRKFRWRKGCDSSRSSGGGGGEGEGCRLIARYHVVVKQGTGYSGVLLPHLATARSSVMSTAWHAPCPLRCFSVLR